jgi:hypothetical protein
MRHLSAALYCEGANDAQFLRPLLLRLCEDKAALAQETVEVADVMILDDHHQDRHRSRGERIERAARAADGAWTVLFIHADADGRDGRPARAERVQPAVDRLRDVLGPTRQAVGVVPIRMTDAWVLADLDAFRSGVGTTLDARALGLLEVLAHGADHVPDPKGLLRAAFAKARPRAKGAQLGAYLGLIAESVSIDHLRRLEAFRHLESDLEEALRNLGIVR